MCLASQISSYQQGKSMRGWAEAIIGGCVGVVTDEEARIVCSWAVSDKKVGIVCGYLRVLGAECSIIDSCRK